ncbi:hypothetical protein [Actinoplanes philippinensis]|nr:hypothetical protein [Actinoplanes philippinensis]
MHRDAVVIGGSAGSHKPPARILASLPADLPATVPACPVGHSYSPQSLLAIRSDDAEEATCTAVSAVQEKSMIVEELMTRSRTAGDRAAAGAYAAKATRADHAAAVLQEHITRSATAPARR